MTVQAFAEPAAPIGAEPFLADTPPNLSVQRATSMTPGPGASGDPEQQLDDLASKLYGRFRNRLATELLLDRERAGMLMDAR